MNISPEFQKVVKFSAIILMLFTFIGLAEKIRLNLQPNDSSAIFGGQLEKGYDFAGYVVSEKSANEVEVCGMVLINASTAITAAHCVDENTKVYVGVGDFSTNSDNYFEVNEVNIHPDWYNGNPIAGDLAVLQLKNEIILNEYGKLSEPDISCNYTIVGYGKQDNSTDFYPLRKSATLCIQSSDFSDGSISFNGESGGLCFGDSGSPIFKTGTNEFISVASRIDACYTKNFGTGAQINEQINNLNFNFTSPVLAGDLCGSNDSNSDGILTSEDLNTFISFYGKNCSDSGREYSCGGKDSDLSGKIDLIDLSSFAIKYALTSCQ